MYFWFYHFCFNRKKNNRSYLRISGLKQESNGFYASRAYPVDYPDADVIIMLHRKGFRFKEVPVVMHNAAKPSMHGGIINPLYYIFKMLLSIFVTLLRKE